MTIPESKLRELWKNGDVLPGQGVHIHFFKDFEAIARSIESLASAPLSAKIVELEEELAVSEELVYQQRTRIGELEKLNAQIIEEKNQLDNFLGKKCAELETSSTRASPEQPRHPSF